MPTMVEVPLYIPIIAISADCKPNLKWIILGIFNKQGKVYTHYGLW